MQEKISVKTTFRTPEFARSNGRIDEIRLSLNSRGAAEESVAAPRLAELHNSTTAFSRGYVLTPLRGWITHPEFLELRSSAISGVVSSEL